MHGPAANALTVILFGLSGLFLLGAAAKWARVAEDRERPDESPALSVRSVRSAAGVTAAAFLALGIAVVWLALTALP
jgi:hypothetical protein